ncbi:MAG TPA: glutathione S-transferase family protein [Polyangiaceae bacterium]
MRLFYHPFSANSRRVLMAAAHLGIELELVKVDLPKGQHRTDGFLRINPNGRVPVLDDDHFMLWESRAIMQYLADKTPGQSLYPQDPRARADVNRWLFWDAAHFSPGVGLLLYENLIKSLIGEGRPDKNEVQRGEGLVARFAKVLDAHLAFRTWVAGDHVSLADLSLAAPLAFAQQAAVPIAGLPNVALWLERVQALDAWQKTLPR